MKVCEKCGESFEYPDPEEAKRYTGPCLCSYCAVEAYDAKKAREKP
jgi:hypothetical protein